MAVSIRRAGPTDYPAIQPLAAELHNDHVDAHPDLFKVGGTAVPEERFTALVRSPLSDVFIAEEDGLVAGYAIARLFPPTRAERVLADILPKVPARTTRPLVHALRSISRRREDKVLLRSRLAFLDSIFVAKTFRGRGVGKQLIQCWVDWARAHHADRLQLEVYEFNQTAIEMYERLGLLTEKRVMATPLTEENPARPPS